MLWDSYFLSCVAKWNFRKSKSHGLCITSAGDSVWWWAECTPSSPILYNSVWGVLLGFSLHADWVKMIWLGWHHVMQQWEGNSWGTWTYYCISFKSLMTGTCIISMLAVETQSCKCYVKNMPFCVCKSFVFWSFEQRTNFSVVLS